MIHQLQSKELRQTTLKLALSNKHDKHAGILEVELSRLIDHLKTYFLE